MKQRLLIAAMGLLTAITGNAQNTKSYFINASSMKEVFISDNVEVMLVAAADNENLLKIDKSIASDYTVFSSGSALHIYGNRFDNRKTKDIIYLTVGQLDRITIDGNVHLKTHGALSSQKVDLYVGGDSQVQLKTNGQVKVHSFNDAEIKYEMRNVSDNSLIAKKS